MPPNKNETERDGQKLHSSQLILADEVKQIARRLKKLRKMCADPEKRVRDLLEIHWICHSTFSAPILHSQTKQKLIEIKPIVKTMESLAEHLVGDISYLFETIFIKHMEIVMVSLSIFHTATNWEVNEKFQCRIFSPTLSWIIRLNFDGSLSSCVNWFRQLDYPRNFSNTCSRCGRVALNQFQANWSIKFYVKSIVF